MISFRVSVRGLGSGSGEGWQVFTFTSGYSQVDIHGNLGGNILHVVGRCCWMQTRTNWPAMSLRSFTVTGGLVHGWIPVESRFRGVIETVTEFQNGQ